MVRILLATRASGIRIYGAKGAEVAVWPNCEFDEQCHNDYRRKWRDHHYREITSRGKRPSDYDRHIADLTRQLASVGRARAMLLDAG